MEMSLYDWKHLTLDLHAANYGGIRHCGSGDKIFCICHLSSKNHVFKRLCDFMGGRSL